jgi:hypothetical protein
MLAVFSGSSTTAYSVISMQRRSPGNVVRGETVLHELDQVGRGELRRRHVDAHDERQIRVARAPLGQLATGFGEDPAADRQNEAGLFGDGDELGRVHQALRRVLPAHERLDRASNRPVRRSTSGW